MRRTAAVILLALIATALFLVTLHAVNKSIMLMRGTITPSSAPALCMVKRWHDGRGVFKQVDECDPQNTWTDI